MDAECGYQGHRPAHRTGTIIGITVVLFLAALVPHPSQAMERDNDEALICQIGFFATAVASEIVAIVAPAPFDLPPSLLAFTANLGLRYCPAVLNAPPDIVANDSLFADDTSATSFDAEIDDPFVNDPACYASVAQSITQTTYESFFGIETFVNEWGGLGAPVVAHLDTAVDVRLYGGTIDNPSTPGDESLNDGWKTYPRAGGGTEVRVPVGKNRLIYRADTLISVVDLIFVYLPELPVTSKPYKELVEKSGKLKATIIKGFEALYDARGVITSAGLVALEDALGPWRHSQLGLDDIYVDAYQDVWVFDSIPPVISTATDTTLLSPRSQAVVSYDAARDVFNLEAIQPGGILANEAEKLLEPLLSYNDHCGRQVRLASNGGGLPLWATGSTIDLVWTVSDPGPSNAMGDRNTASITHTIDVRDSFPPVLLAPPSRVFELPAGQEDQTIGIDLGVPRVFDLANLTPDVMNDAVSNDFGLGLTEVTWTASDGFNSSTAVQLINVKEEGTNTPPVADTQQVETLSFAETEIVLTGSDGDFHESVNRFDPLTFSIVEPPAHGDLVAPLLPYFIDDVRLEASALRFAGDLMQEDPVAYCREAGSGQAFQQLYPRWPEWIAVDDEGNTIVYDVGSILCNNGDTDFKRRLAIFNADQDLIEYQELLDGGTPSDIFWDQRTDWIYVARVANEDVDTIDVFASDLTPIARYDLEAGIPADELERPVSVSVDSRGIMYVANNIQVNAYRPLNRRPNQPGAIVRLDGDEELLDSAVVPATYVGINSIATDSADNLYISLDQRIVKIGAAGFETPPFIPIAGQPRPEPVFTPGEQIGWLGACSANLTTEYACDTVGQRSLGYACSDTLCSGLAFGEDANKPGQLRSAQGISVDPNDVLYVADSGNRRIQRFTPEGNFGGEARSTGAGFGFLLGDFGYPTDIEVNSDHFYILDRDASLLHSFETTPITPIDDGSASVTYRSDNNFVGSDQFRFGVTDGFDSDEATVDISVTRNFRPPEIPQNSLLIEVAGIIEDTPRTITVIGVDPDGEQDTLSVLIFDPPQHGTVDVDGLRVTYIPDPNYFGDDEFSYQVFDGTDTSEQVGVVRLTVEPEMDPPTVIVASASNASLGYLVRHSFAVEDPDPNEIFTFIINWGDGETTGEGRFELNGVPIPADEVFNDDGTVRDGVTVTGPVLGTGADGSARGAADHVFVMGGTYPVTTCVYDQVRVDAVTQIKSMTAESQMTCSQTDISVDLSAQVLIDIAGPAEELPKGSDAEYRINVRNRPFDIAQDDPRFALLPTSGFDVANLLVAGEIPAGLELLDLTSSDSVCSSSGKSFECNVAMLPYAAEVTLNPTMRVTEAAPGRAQLGFLVDGTWSGGREASFAAGIARVQSTGEPPVLQDVVPAAARAEDYAVVTLQGSGFEQGTRVFFGPRPGQQLQIIDSTTLTVHAPSSSPGVVDIVVENPDGQTFVLPGGWTYLESVTLPPPDPDPVPQPRRGGGSTGPLALVGLLLLVSVAARSRRRFCEETLRGRQ